MLGQLQFNDVAGIVGNIIWFFIAVIGWSINKQIGKIEQTITNIQEEQSDLKEVLIELKTKNSLESEVLRTLQQNIREREHEFQHIKTIVDELLMLRQEERIREQDVFRGKINKEN